MMLTKFILLQNLKRGGSGNSAENLNIVEKEFLSIYNKAREYRERLGKVENSMANMQGGSTQGGDWDHPYAPAPQDHKKKFGVEVIIDDDSDSDDMMGGADEDTTDTDTASASDITVDTPAKKKRGGTPQFMKFLELVSVMKDSNKYPNIKRAQLMKIAKFVTDKAKELTKSTDVNVYSKKAAEIAVKDSESFLKQFAESQSAPASRVRRFY